MIAGAVAAQGHAPLSFALATLAGFALAAGLLVTCTAWRQAAVIGGVFGFGYFFVALFWIIEPFLVYASEDGWMAPFAIIGIGVGLGLLWSVAFALAYALGVNDQTRVLALAAAIALVGLLREFLFTGFPWALPAYIWSETPVAQSLAWLGPHFLSFLTVLAGAAYLLFRRPYVGVIIATSGIAVFWLMGEVRLKETRWVSMNETMIRVVQPNVQQDKKWDRQYFQDHFIRLLVLTAKDSESPLEAIVWPETAATFLLESGDERLNMISAAANDKPVAIGIRRLMEGRQYNSLAIIGQKGVIKDVYDKQKLVPFGEYIPFLSWLPFRLSGLAVQSLSRFTRGSSERFVELGQLGTFMALICYESIFPRFVRQAPRRDGMVQVTNDGWFGTFSGPQQHFAQARMRSIELGLPLIRAANSGISAVVDSRGQIIQSLPLGVAGVIDAPMPVPLPPTIYSRTGDLPLFFVMIAALGFCLAKRKGLRQPD